MKETALNNNTAANFTAANIDVNELTTENLLFEIHSEELPATALLKMAKNLATSLEAALIKMALPFAAMTYFATPRRLAVFIKALAPQKAAQIIERKGPSIAHAFDASGNPTPAALGFAKSCGVAFTDLTRVTEDSGERLSFRQQEVAQTVFLLLPKIIKEVLHSLPLPRKMRWGNKEIEFTRPVHTVILMYGQQIIDAEILGCQTSNKTRGHRFHADQVLTVTHANDYVALLQNNFVIADFSTRRNTIVASIPAVLATQPQKNLSAKITPHLLDEVTGLVEWPVALCGRFADHFLALPEEVLISCMQDHQRYFPVVDDKDNLAPYFITICNIASKNREGVIRGNERVLRARLADAAFFYAADKAHSLLLGTEKLKGILFHAKLGTLYGKAERMQHLAAFIAAALGANQAAAERSSFLAKADLTSRMVTEFPELQGVMGRYYALHDGETADVATAIKEHYLPRFAGDILPATTTGKIVALADRIDTLIGYFGVSEIPTGDKDPYGLRRAALGVIRLIIEGGLKLDYWELLAKAHSLYHLPLENKTAIAAVFDFTMERLKAWYAENGISYDVFAAVAALQKRDLLDVDYRLKAVLAFKQLAAAEHLSTANKRVGNILMKYTAAVSLSAIDPIHFELPIEHELAAQLNTKNKEISILLERAKYQEALFLLAELHTTVDQFFNQVMVMVDEKERRENRILLLQQLRHLFLQVADIALLQSR